MAIIWDRLPMRFAYLILAHRDLRQIERLVSRLLRDDRDDIIVLHVDRRSAISTQDLTALAAAYPTSRILITPRVACRWGHPSLCETVVLLMRRLDGIEYDHCHLISGQDWPTCSKAAIAADIEAGACYVTFAPQTMPERMNDYHFHNRLLAPNATSIGARGLRKALMVAGAGWNFSARMSGRVRHCPIGPDWQRGPAWWSLPRDAVEFLAENMAAMLRSGRLRHTLCSDEHVPQTILAYSPFADRIRPNRRFIIWNGGSSPAMLGAGDLPAIETSQSWFARKVSLAHDPFFLNL